MSSEDIESLIELIEWYRDEYHKNRSENSRHNEMIRNLKEDPETYFSLYERWVDDWIDY